MAEPNKQETITFDTLKRLLGAQQARSIFEQKRAAEIGIVYNGEAVAAMEKIIDSKAFPLERDVRIAAPAMAAYLRGSFTRTRKNATEWIRHWRMRGEIEPTELPAPKAIVRRPSRNAWDKSMTAERDAAFAQGMGFCPNHPPGERVKPRSEFGLDKKGPFGLAYRCKSCALASRSTGPARQILLSGDLAAEKREAMALGLGFCPEHPSKEERFQPRENFYYKQDAPDHLSYRCKMHTAKPKTDWSKVRNPEAIRKAFTISHKANELKRTGISHAEAVEQARLWYAEQQQSPAPNGNDGNAVTDLPPVPDDTERPYEETTEPEPELVAAIAEEEHR